MFLKYLLCIYMSAILIIGFGNSSDTPSKESLKAYYDNIINTVNGGNNFWKAEYNFNVKDLSPILYKSLAGTLDENDKENYYDDEDTETDDEDETDDSDDDNEGNDDSNEVENNSADTTTVEEIEECNHLKADRTVKESANIADVDNFDAREKWNYCPTIRKIWNQGHCSADWVIAPVSAIADRICIATNGAFNKTISPQRPLTCCKTCGWGCRGGFPGEVWHYWVQKGLVTGGLYKSHEGCQPYTIKPVSSIAESWPSFSQSNIETPRCRKRCFNRKYDKKYKEDLIKGKAAYNIGCPCCISNQIRRNGPVTSTLVVFEDFLFYKSGVYHHVAGKRIGSLSVRVLGWGIDEKNNNTKYWLAANSWGTEWGEKGVFKIRRFDECNFDVRFKFGIARVPKKTDSSEY